MANHYDEVPIPAQPTGRCKTCNALTGGNYGLLTGNGVAPSAVPLPVVGAEMAFIDSDDVYQECTVRSVLDGYAWVQKTSGKLNTVPVSKLISRKSERDLFSDEVTSLIKDEHGLENIIKRLWCSGYRKTGGSNDC